MGVEICNANGCGSRAAHAPWLVMMESDCVTVLHVPRQVLLLCVASSTGVAGSCECGNRSLTEMVCPEAALPPPPEGIKQVWERPGTSLRTFKR